MTNTAARRQAVARSRGPRRAAGARRVAIGAALLLASTAVPSLAQQRTRRSLDDAALAVFGRRDGLPESALISLTADSSGTIWLATAEGPRHFNGYAWNTLTLPADIPDRLSRAVLSDGDGIRWFVQNNALVSFLGRGFGKAILTPSLDPIYAATLTTAINGKPSIVLGGRQGVFRLTPERTIVPVVLPRDFRLDNAMVTSRTVGGVAELWVGTLGGGVARLRSGQWTAWGSSQGLDTLVDHVHLPPAGDSLTAIAATASGLYGLRDGRWSHFGPKVRASRALRVRHGDRTETWMGTLTGEIIRSPDGVRWDTLDVPLRLRGSRVQFVEAVDNGLAEPTVYVGFRSGALMRFRTGVAGRLRGNTQDVVDVVSTRDGRGVWIWSVGAAAWRFPEAASPPPLREMLDNSDAAFSLLADSRDAATELLAAGRGRVYALRNGAWTTRLTLDATDTVRTLLRAPTPDGRMQPILVSHLGARVEQADGSFAAWPGFPLHSRAATVDSSGDTPVLYVADLGGHVREFSAGTWREIRAGNAPAAARLVQNIASWRYPSGERGVWIATSQGLLALRTSGGEPSWRIFNDKALLALRNDNIRDVRTLPNGRLAVATQAGLVVLEPGRAFADSVQAVANITDADGLPHPDILHIGPIDADGRLWLGTPLGGGYFNLASIGRDKPRANALAVILRGPSGPILRSDVRVAASAGRLDIELFFTTNHREDDSRFRVELDGEPLQAGGWTNRRTTALLALAPGTHVLKAWSADWRGLVVGPVNKTIVVAPPWWRSPVAGLTYAVLAIGIGFGAATLRARQTRRRMAEAEANELRLATSEARFRRLFEDGANPQLLVLNGSIWQANAAAAALFSAGDGAALLNRRAESVLPGLATLWPAGPGGAPDTAPLRGELVARTSADAEIPVEVRRTLIPLDDANIDHLELRDLRQERAFEDTRRSLEEQLRESQRLESLGTMAGGVAHDFNNILTVIQANAEVAGSGSTTPEAAEALDQLLIASERARDIVRQILTFSRRAPALRVPVSVAALMAELQPMLRASVPSTVRIDVVNAADGAWVLGDPTQLHQMLLNLCTNAEHAMRATGGGDLSLQVTWLPERAGDSPTICIRVRDTGTGIPEGVLGRIFDPFFTTKPVGEGTGLGLSVLHGIVGAHGGSVHVESVPGAGTTFEIRLPATPAPAASTDGSHVADADSQANSLRGLTVLVVDDEPSVARAMQRLLAHEGLVVETVLDGATAVARFSDGATYDLVITDQTMPGLTGDQVAEQIHTLAPQVPILISSGYSMSLTAERIAAIGAVGLLEKPFARARLLAAVRDAIFRQR